MAKELTRKENQAPAAAERATEKAVFVPNVDITETPDEFRLIADLPGVDEQSVEIDLDRNELSISAESTHTVPEGTSQTYREFRTGRYERVFTLGDSVDREGIQAVVKDGVLRLTLPKVKEVKPQKIAVNAG